MEIQSNVYDNIPRVRSTHIIRGNELTEAEILSLVDFAQRIKSQGAHYSDMLRGFTIAVVMEKPSLRTKFSFVAGLQAAGAHIVESSKEQMHSLKKELPKDFIRVVEGFCDALVYRTHEDSILEEMCKYSNIPIISGLSKNFHPCQILSDVFTIKEHFNTLRGLKLCYLGDGNNILNTMLLMLPILGIEVHYACPKGFEPNLELVKSFGLNISENFDSLVKAFVDPFEAVDNCDIVYTDVWTSMGYQQRDESHFQNFQVNEEKISRMNKDAVLMHCLPMERGKELSEDIADSSSSIIFAQAHNRMYMQLALLISILRAKKHLS